MVNGVILVADRKVVGKTLLLICKVGSAALQMGFYQQVDGVELLGCQDTSIAVVKMLGPVQGCFCCVQFSHCQIAATQSQQRFNQLR